MIGPRSLTIPIVLAGGFLAACGGSSTVEPALETPDTPMRFESDGLSCPQDLMEHTEHEAGMADPGSGHASIIEAVDHYWSDGDGTFRDDRSELAQAVDAPTVTYEDAEGHALLILRFVELDDGWHIDQSSACYLGDNT